LTSIGFPLLSALLETLTGTVITGAPLYVSVSTPKLGSMVFWGAGPRTSDPIDKSEDESTFTDKGVGPPAFCVRE
jgi:hypothetical protein